MRQWTLCWMVCLMMCLPLGCAGTENRTEQIPAETRRPSEGLGLGSRDLLTATEQAVASIAQVEAIRRDDGRTPIVVDRVFNETSDASRDFQIFLARIRAMLNQSALNQDLVFVESRDKAEAILQREGYPPEQTARTVPDYALTATFNDLPRGRTNYYLLTFQLINLRNQQQLWEDFYEVKLERSE